jgi:5'-nucleotidase
MSDRKRILLTNDDGYYSDGINALYRALARKHDVIIVAPDREQSASSHSLTLERPLRIQKINDYTYATDGTPTDCVMLAVHRLFKKKMPDMIVSGINHGANMGDDITYSGTVAAAIEGSIMGIPSVAASMSGYEPGMRFSYAARFVARFVNQFDALEIDPSVFININFPPDRLKIGRTDPYRKWTFTRQGCRQYKDIIIRKTDPRGKPYYWIGGRPEWRMTRGSDFAAVNRGVVSITPLKLNFTDNTSLEKLRDRKIKI